MRLLITGGAGFIGSHLATHHISNGDEVWVIDNLSTGSIANLKEVASNPLFRFTQADLLNCSELEKAVSWADGIYHLAAVVGQNVVITHPCQVITSNINGCLKLLEFLAEKPSCRLLIASTSEVYGQDGKSSFQEEAPLTFPSAECIQVNYPLSKYVNETMALSYVQEKKIECVIARLFNTTGPNQTGRYGMVVPRFISQALAGEPLTVFGDGSQTRSFCDVRDTISMLSRLMLTPGISGEIFNVGNDREISILDLAKLIVEQSKSNSSITFTSYEIAYGMPFKDTLRRCPNLKKIQEKCGLMPNFTLEQTLDWMIKTKSQEKIARII